MLPRKKFFSVKIDKQAAPDLQYSFAMAIGSKSFLKTPLEGLAFLISAIIAVLLLFLKLRSCFLKLKFFFLIFLFNTSMGIFFLSKSTSFFFEL